MTELTMHNAAVNEVNLIAGFDVRPPYQVFVPRWTAYIKPFFVFLSFGTVGGLMTSIFWLPGTLMLLGALALFVYQVLLIHSVRLFTHPDGVWVYSGVFPWNRGVSGVRWRDLREATFSQSFFGWLFKAYPVTVTNRYQGNNEISLPHIKNGDQAAMHINDLHVQLIGKGEVDAPEENEVSQA